MITKDQASDLSSFVARLKETALQLQTAEWAHDKAKRDYDAFVWKLQKSEQPA